MLKGLVLVSNTILVLLPFKHETVLAVAEAIVVVVIVVLIKVVLCGNSYNFGLAPIYYSKPGTKKRNKHDSRNGRSDSSRGSGNSISKGSSHIECWRVIPFWYYSPVAVLVIEIMFVFGTLTNNIIRFLRKIYVLICFLGANERNALETG